MQNADIARIPTCWLGSGPCLMTANIVTLAADADVVQTSIMQFVKSHRCEICADRETCVVAVCDNVAINTAPWLIPLQ